MKGELAGEVGRAILQTLVVYVHNSKQITREFKQTVVASNSHQMCHMAKDIGKTQEPQYPEVNTKV